MDDTVARAAAAVLVAVVAVAGAALVLSSARTAPRRALLPTVAAALLLASFAITSLGGVFGGDGRLMTLSGQAFFPLFALFAATFPDGRFVPRPVALVVLLFTTAVVADQISGQSLSSSAWWWLVPTIGCALLLAAQIWRYRRSATTRERERVRWVLLGVLLSVAAYAVLTVVDDGVAGTGPASEARATLAILPILLGLVVGIARPRLANVDALLRAVLVAWLSVLITLPVFWGAGLLTGALGVTAVAAGWWWAAAVLAVAYPAVRLALRLADLIVYRGRATPDAAVALLGRRLAAEPDAATVPGIIADVVAESTGSPRVRLRSDGDGVPISYQGEVLGVLDVAPRPGESELTRRDRATIAAVAIHAGPALAGARSAAELAQAHARLLIAREEERRRLRRDLHDDLSPTLSGLALGAAALSRTLAGSDAVASAQARELQSDIQAAVEQSRDIAHGLRPTVLDDLGLVAAIRDRTVIGDDPALRIEVVDAGVPAELPAAVDLAALRIAQEAVANVRRHARARSCRVELGVDAETLHLTVDDDGAGLPATIRPGMGVASIRERAAELGGSATFGRSPTGGARVAVRLPLVPA